MILEGRDLQFLLVPPATTAVHLHVWLWCTCVIHGNVATMSYHKVLAGAAIMSFGSSVYDPGFADIDLSKVGDLTCLRWGFEFFMLSHAKMYSDRCAFPGVADAYVSVLRPRDRFRPPQSNLCIPEF